MPKFTRGLVLGAMLAVLSSATAAVAQEPSNSWNEPIAQYRAGERASMDQPVSQAGAVQRFRAGERASMDQPISDQATEQAVAQQRRWYYESTHPVRAPVAPAAPSEQPGQPVAPIAALAAAVLAVALGAMSVRRRARKAAHSAT